MRLLLSTRYVDVGRHLLRKAYELERTLVCLTTEPLNTDQINKSLEFTKEFRDSIMSIQRSIEAGAFVEPSKLSQVSWKVSSYDINK